MYPHPLDIDTFNARPPTPAAVSQWHAERRIARRTLRRRSARIVDRLRFRAATPATGGSATDLVATGTLVATTHDLAEASR
jgi:hypothetical protein